MAANTPSTASLAISLLRPVQAGSRPAISTSFVRSGPHHPILSCSPIIRRRNRDHPPADADGLPPKRNPDPALGACRSRCGRDSPRRREDWRPHGPPATIREDTVRSSVSLGGDADTLDGIAGPIVESMFGIPEKFIDAM